MGLTGILVLISNFVFGTVGAISVGVAAAIVVTSVLFALPLGRRQERSYDLIGQEIDRFSIERRRARGAHSGSSCRKPQGGS